MLAQIEFESVLEVGCGPGDLASNILPPKSQSYDLTIACEVLEHLEDPGQALTEIDRVTKQSVLISVPQEPMWRILNMARGKYWSDLGNTPGHV